MTFGPLNDNSVGSSNKINKIKNCQKHESLTTSGPIFVYYTCLHVSCYFPGLAFQSHFHRSGDNTVGPVSAVDVDAIFL